MSSDAVSVTNLLETFGQDLTLARAGASTYNPATGTVSNGSPVTFVCRGVFIYRDQMNADGTVVRRAERRLLIDAATTGGTPQVGDVVYTRNEFDHYGLITDAATLFENWGSVADAVTESEDYGTIADTLSANLKLGSVRSFVPGGTVVAWDCKVDA